MKIGITGHQKLKDLSWDWCKNQMSTILDNLGSELIGYSCLAAGADQIFVRILLEKGGNFIAILPFNGIERTFKDSDDLLEFNALLHIASEVKILPDQPDDEISYFNAGKLVVDFSEMLVAVWDGKAAAGLGGTGDIVKYAQKLGKNIIIINPYLESVSPNEK